MTNCEYCGGSGDVHTIDGEWRGECPVCPQAPTMTPETREELARAIRPLLPILNSYEAGLAITAIAPIIERLVAERVAGETERCAGIVRNTQPLPQSYSTGTVVAFNRRIAALEAAIRSATQ